MKKNKYNFPRRATNSNNSIYNQFVEDVYFENDYDGPFSVPDTERDPEWKKNHRLDMYHESYDNTDYYQDPATVAQHYIERTEMTHG